MSVTVPAGSTVTVAGGTPGIVPVSNIVAIASGLLSAQFIATGFKNANQTIQQRAPGTPLTLLQVHTACVRLKDYSRFTIILPIRTFTLH